MPSLSKKPHIRHVIGEAFVGLEALSMPGALIKAGLTPKTAEPRYPVMVLPGFGANDLSTAPLRRFLSLKGYSCEGWGLGLNTGGRGLVQSVDEVSDRWQFDRARAQVIDVEVPALCDVFFAHLERRVEALQSPISLIGWSLGGYIAREAARELPDCVTQVITLGSPVNGGPKHTSIAPVFKLRGVNLDLIEDTIEERAEKPITVPVTAIYAKRDGVVSEYAAIDRHSPNVRHIGMSASHIGLGLNAKVWNEILHTLDALPA